MIQSNKAHVHRTAPAVVPALCNEYHVNYHAIGGRTFGDRYERKAHEEMAEAEEKGEQEDKEDPLELVTELTEQRSVVPVHHRVDNLSISGGVLHVLRLSSHIKLPII